MSDVGERRSWKGSSRGGREGCQSLLVMGERASWKGSSGGERRMSESVGCGGTGVLEGLIWKGERDVRHMLVMSDVGEQGSW
jgi:hypothetical protein